MSVSLPRMQMEWAAATGLGSSAFGLRHRTKLLGLGASGSGMQFRGFRV